MQQSVRSSFQATHFIHVHSCNSVRQPRFPSKRSTVIRATEDRKSEGSDDSPERLFVRELQKRGIFDKDSDRSSGKTSSSKPDPAPQFSQKEILSQLQLSRKLNSEGLEGLIPRAKQLLSLGLTFWLAFWPIVLVVSLLTSAIVWLYGSNFIHGGKPSYFKRVAPDEILSEPAYDKRVPFR